jgi:hypothetical protein
MRPKPSRSLVRRRAVTPKPRRRIRQDILREKRTEYGEQIVYALSR